MATLRDIARHLGCSVSVVSRSLNPRPDANARVSKDTRDKVLEAARELGYQPNRAAEFLKRGKRPSIMAVLHLAAPRLTVDLVAGIAEAAEARGFPLALSFNRSVQGYRRMLEQAPDQAHCGLITCPYGSPEHDETGRLIERFRKARGKVVVVHNNPGRADLCAVLIDDWEGGRMAGRHLLGRGCASFVGYNCSEDPNAAEFVYQRTRGYMQVLRDAGRDAVLLCENDRLERLAALATMLPRPIGVFATTDRDAIGILCRCPELGLQVGRDLLLIGYDDLDLTANVRPSLTTLHQPMRDIGALAVEKVLNMLYGQDEQTTKVPPRLVVRESA